MMQRISVSLADPVHTVLHERAQREGRSVSQLARVLLEAALTEGAAIVRVVDTPETVAQKASQARQIAEIAQRVLHPEDEDDQGAAHTPPEVIEQMEREAAEERRPEPERPFRGPDPKVKPKPRGTVSARQALKAEEAQRRREEAASGQATPEIPRGADPPFADWCPATHTPGTRCPVCKGTH